MIGQLCRGEAGARVWTSISSCHDSALDLLVSGWLLSASLTLPSWAGPAPNQPWWAHLHQGLYKAALHPVLFARLFVAFCRNSPADFVTCLPVNPVCFSVTGNLPAFCLPTWKLNLDLAFVCPSWTWKFCLFLFLYLDLGNVFVEDWIKDWDCCLRTVSDFACFVEVFSVSTCTTKILLTHVNVGQCCSLLLLLSNNENAKPCDWHHLGWLPYNTLDYLLLQ